ncbi:MAG TPA: hypothetical protein PLL89_01615, partial [bacterium]|nr:hypothetical protein [bacterium]
MTFLKEVVLTNQEAQVIFGKHDEHLRLLEDLLGIEIFARGNIVKLKGEPLRVEKAQKTFDNLRNRVHRMKYLSPQDIFDAMPEDEQDLTSVKKQVSKHPFNISDAIIIGSKK